MHRDQTDILVTPETQLAAALNKLFSSFSVYPKGHMRCEEAADELRVEIDHVTQGAACLTLDFGKNYMLVQSREADLECQDAKRLHDLFSSLGIARLELERSLTVDDLHDFIAEVNRCRQKTLSSSGFKQIELGDLPDTIRASQREFGRRVSVGNDSAFQGEMISAALQDTLDYLSEQASDSELQQAGRALVENMFAKVAERFEMEAQKPLLSGNQFGKSLDEALNLGVYAIQHAITKMFSDKAVMGNIKDLFSMAEKAVALSDDQQSVKLMLDILKQCKKESSEANAVSINKDEAEFELTLPEFQELFDSYVEAGAPLEMLDLDNRAEALSIMFQLLFSFPSSKALGGIEEELGQILSGPMGASERRVLFAGIRELVGYSGHAIVDRFLPMVFKPLRSGESISLSELLTKIVGDASAKESEALWPHLVNEALIGFQNLPRSRAMEVYEEIGTLKGDSLTEGIQRLAALESMRTGTIAKKLFDPMPDALCPVFALLLDSPQENKIGKLLIQGFRKVDLGSPFDEALLVFNDYSLKSKPFLTQLLNEYPGRNYSRGLKVRAVKAISIDLLNCPHEKREAPWVQKVIAGLGHSHVSEARSTLEKIVKSKNKMFFHDWPATCRTAAKAALKELKRGGED